MQEAFKTRESWKDANKAAVVVGNKNDLEIYRKVLEIIFADENVLIQGSFSS